MILEEILELAVRRGLNVTEDNKPAYIDFLQRQVAAHPDYELVRHNKVRFSPDASLLADKTYVFGCLTRLQKVKDKVGDQKIIIEEEDLRLLKIYGADHTIWDDTNLGRVYVRNTRSKTKMKYKEIVDEVGQDPFIVRIWGRELTYDKDIFFRKKQHYVRSKRAS